MIRGRSQIRRIPGVNKIRAAGNPAWLIDSTFSLAQTKDMTGSGGVSNLWGVYFKPDGLICYIIDAGNDEVRQYNLSIAWDLSTINATSPDATFDTSAELSETVPGEVFVSPDGGYLFVAGGGNDGIFRLTLSTPWALSTASYGARLPISLMRLLRTRRRMGLISVRTGCTCTSWVTRVTRSSITRLELLGI